MAPVQNWVPPWSKGLNRAKNSQARTRRAWGTPATLASVLSAPQDCMALPVLRLFPRTHPLTISGRFSCTGPHSLPSGTTPTATMSTDEPPSYSDEHRSAQEEAHPGLYSLRTCNQRTAPGMFMGRRGEVRKLGWMSKSSPPQHQQQTDTNTHTLRLEP